MHSSSKKTSPFCLKINESFMSSLIDNIHMSSTLKWIHQLKHYVHFIFWYMKIVNLILLDKYSLREETFVENTFAETNFAHFQQKCQIKFYKYIFDRHQSEKHGYFLVEPIAKIHPANKSLYLGFEIRFSNF